MMIFSLFLLSSITLFAANEDDCTYALISQHEANPSDLARKVPLHILVNAQKAIPDAITHALSQDDKALAVKSQEELQALCMLLRAQKDEEIAGVMKRAERYNCCGNFERGMEACGPIISMSFVGAFLSGLSGLPLGPSLLFGAGTGVGTATCLAIGTWPRKPEDSSFDMDIARVDGMCKKPHTNDGMKE